MFADRGGGEVPPEMKEWLADVEDRRVEKGKSLFESKTKNPDVAALIEYDKIAEYSRQLSSPEGGYVWTESRKALFSEMMRKAAMSKRPVLVLEGETGTGKTAL